MEANRPFYSECWATDGITMLTIYVSKIGIENIKVKDLLSKLVNIDYVKSKNGKIDGKIGEFVDDNNNTFYVINITVGLPDEPH